MKQRSTTTILTVTALACLLAVPALAVLHRHRRVPAVGRTRPRLRHLPVVHLRLGPQPQRARPPTSSSGCSSATAPTPPPRSSTTPSPRRHEALRQRRRDDVRRGVVRRPARHLLPEGDGQRPHLLPGGRRRAARDSVGQFFAAIPASFAIGSGQSTTMLGVYQTSPQADSQFRYNFGFVETFGSVRHGPRHRPRRDRRLGGQQDATPWAATRSGSTGSPTCCPGSTRRTCASRSR